MLRFGLATAATAVAAWPGVRALAGSRATRAMGAVHRLGVRDRVDRYARELSTPEPPHLAAVAAETRDVSNAPYMMVGVTQGHLLATLVHALRATSVLEIGTFTGYSALAMARALAPGGRLVTCELDPRHAEIARRHIDRATRAGLVGDGVVDVRVGPALDTIAGLPGPFDLVFVDADKAGYVDYYDAVLDKLAPHGLIAVDNTLHGGLTPHDAGDRAMVEALLRFNAHVAADPRVEQVVLPLRDGLTLVRRVPVSAR